MQNNARMEERRRYDILQRAMLALREARGQSDVLALAARGLGEAFGRPCLAYEMRNNTFRAVANPKRGPRRLRGPKHVRELDSERLRSGELVRLGTRDYVAISPDGILAGLLVLERATHPLDDEDILQIRSLASQASLAIAGGIALERLRQYASEGAALTEAARTILTFTALEPLATSLCRLAVSLVRADHACLYVPRSGKLERIADVCGGERCEGPASLSLDKDEARYNLRTVFGSPVMLPIVLPREPGEGHEPAGLFAVWRAEAFETAELRIVETLVGLGASAMRNVDLYARAEHANRALLESNAFKDDLMAMFAHDFRGPLTVILGLSEQLAGLADPVVRDSARKIVAQTRRLATLADEALALAATQTADYSVSCRRLDLGAFVRSATAALGSQAERIVLALPEEPLLVRFDPARLRHAVDNLLANALKYSTRRVEIRVLPAPGEVRVDVADKGIGVPAAELAAIFGRFVRATNARARSISGSGVGLYIARKIVEAHGGRLDVRSKENEGSTFSIALPL